MNAPARFKQIDVTRAVRGVMDAGQLVNRVEIGPHGKIVVFTGQSTNSEGPNSWDEVLKPSYQPRKR